MFFFKINFQIILMISIVLISSTYAVVDPIKLKNCLDGMRKIFGSPDKSALECLKYAILHMQLDSGDIGSKECTDAKKYYLNLEEEMDYEQIVLPSAYCANITQHAPEKEESCRKHLHHFKIDSTDKKDVAYAALYINKQDPNCKILNEFPICHNVDSFGFLYLHELHRKIQLKNNDVPDPSRYCNIHYNEDESSSSQV